MMCGSEKLDLINKDTGHQTLVNIELITKNENIVLEVNLFDLRKFNIDYIEQIFSFILKIFG